MKLMDAAQTQTTEHSELGHVTPLWVLLSVWAALAVLTIITVAAAQLDLGTLNTILAIGIATVKALLVALFFMHLVHDRPFHAFLFAAALAFVFIFIGITAIDTAQYKPDRIPEYAPAMQR
jgi:cytochrome c oxidase subunit 4